MNEESMTQEKAEQLLDEWVDILGLQDWDIHLAWQCTPEEMPTAKDEDVAGYTAYGESTKEAEIFIPDEQYIDCKPFKFDFELTLVHELMHLKTCLLTDTDHSSLQYRLMHVLVEDMAKALVKTKRNHNVVLR